MTVGELVEKVKQLQFENPSDKRAVEIILNGKDKLTVTDIKWFKSLLKRNGKRFIPE